MTPNLRGVNKTLRELRRLGRLETVDEARIAMLRSMATALDYDPSNASLWRQYRAALADLLGADDDVDLGLAAALEEIRGAAEVGDSSPS